MPSHDITINPLYKELSAALGHPHFMRGGGVLGFVCHHKYVYTDLNTTSNLPGPLKGADQIVYTVAKSLGLSVIVKPVLGDSRRSPSLRFLLKSFPGFIKPNFGSYEDDGGSPNDEFTSLFNDGHHVKHIAWCQPFDDSLQQAAGCIGTYGNDIGVGVFYQIAAILVGIPEWGEYRKSCAQETSGNESLEPESGEMPAKRHCQSEAILEKLCFHGEMPPDEWSDDDA